MTELAPTEQMESQWRHNWLYSVLPLNNHLYLCGYCRVCDSAFSKAIPHAGIYNSKDSLDIMVTKMDVPKWGCVDPQKILE